jgi:hypothetical protein
MPQLSSAHESPLSLTTGTPLPLTCGRLTTRPKLHSWPGQETFDDVDVDDFECDEDDLPGLRMLRFKVFTVH